MQRSLRAFTFASLALTSLSAAAVDGVVADNFEILQPITGTPGALSGETAAGRYYVPATVDTSRWGHLPSRQAEPVLTVPSGATVVIDTISHEGILEDHGRDPVAWFGDHGVALSEARGRVSELTSELATRDKELATTRKLLAKIYNDPDLKGVDSATTCKTCVQYIGLGV